MFVQGSEWDFGVFSGLEGVEKPDPRIYEIALERAGNIAPEETLHIGDSLRKDYFPAKSVGMHALLLDRFKTPDAEEWRKSGAIVLPDLMAAKDLLTSEKLILWGASAAIHDLHEQILPHHNINDKYFSAGVPPKFWFL